MPPNVDPWLLRSYAMGYYDGRTTGTRHLDWDDVPAGARSYYKAGYDAGVADYCAIHHPEDE